MTGIVFEPLTSSPETVGTGSAVLPRLVAYGQDVAGDGGVQILQPLRTVGTGAYTSAAAANGSAELQPLRTYGWETTLLLANAQAIGYAAVELPPLASYGNTASLVPQSGSGSASIAPLETVGEGYWSLQAEVSWSLQPLTAYGQEVAGDYGIAELPAMRATAVQTVTIPSNFVFALQSPGYLQMFASQKVYLTTEDDAVASDAAPAFEVMFNLVASVYGRDAYQHTFQHNPAFADAARAADAVSFAWSFATSDAAVIADDPALVIQRYLELADRAIADGIFENTLHALVNYAAAATTRDGLTLGWILDAEDGAAAQDAFEDKLRQVLAVADAAIAGDTFEPTVRISMVFADGTVPVDDLALALRLNFDASDTALAYVTMRLGDGSYSGWVMNTETQAPSEYRGLAIDSYATYNGQHYAAGPNGLVRFGGKTDDSAPIPAWLRTFLMDFKTTKLKRGSDVYVGATTSGKLVVKVRTADHRTGQAYEDWYAVESLQIGTPGQGRSKLGQGLTSTWWQFEVHNVKGSDFELDEIDFRPVMLDRSI